MEYKTRYRDWIMNFFEQHPDQKVSASDLRRRMAAEGMTINLTTVYRNLDRMEREKILQGHKIAEEDEKFYQYLRPKMECGRHLHLYCSRCGKIIHLNCGFMKEISDHLMKEHGFLLDCGESMLIGLCRECREKMAEEGRLPQGGKIPEGIRMPEPGSKPDGAVHLTPRGRTGE